MLKRRMEVEVEGDGDGAAVVEGAWRRVANGTSPRLAARAHARGELRNLDTHLHNSRA